jgi:hypothetical protein
MLPDIFSSALEILEKVKMSEEPIKPKVEDLKPAPRRVIFATLPRWKKPEAKPKPLQKN